MTIAKSRKRAVAFAILGLTLLTQAARGADLTSPEGAGEWSFSMAPYLWGAGMKGEVGLFGLEPVDVDASFVDVLDYLKFGGMVVSELDNGTWGVFSDLIYVKLTADQSVERLVAGTPAELSMGVETSSFTGALMGEYHLLSSDRIKFDLMAGARLWSVDNDVSAHLKLSGARVAEFSGSDGDTWVDPMIGAKMRVGTNSPLYFTGWGMIGGFGVGSELSWDVMAGAGYEWNDWLSTVVGYRALSVDYKNDGFVFDVVQQGIIVGAVIHF